MKIKRKFIIISSSIAIIASIITIMVFFMRDCKDMFSKKKELIVTIYKPDSTLVTTELGEIDLFLQFIDLPPKKGEIDLNNNSIIFYDLPKKRFYRDSIHFDLISNDFRLKYLENKVLLKDKLSLMIVNKKRNDEMFYIKDEFIKIINDLSIDYDKVLVYNAKKLCVIDDDLNVSLFNKTRIIKKMTIEFFLNNINMPIVNYKPNDKIIIEFNDSGKLIEKIKLYKQ